MVQYKRHTITAALPYANGPIHFGHLAGCYLPADIYVRYLRSKGEDVAFICGSDENGMAITLRALKEGVKPQDIVNKFHPMIEKSFKGFGISFDIYSRTSSEKHAKVAAEFFKNLDDKDIFVQKKSLNLYDAKFDQFLTDRYVKGTCPNCGNENAYGDQCENCGSSLSATDLINPISTLSGEKPELKETSHWYFPLDKYQEWLEDWVLNQHKDWKSHVYGQCKSWLDAGLQPRAVTRDLTWGVPVPRKDAEGKVLYVWFDAPIGYITATQEWAEREGKNWEDYWKKEDTRLIHFIGKDNIVFHCIFFPAMLKAHGEFVLPDNVPANEFLNLEGNKLSTSRNWAVWLHEYLEEFPHQVDALRYVLCANMPENKDADFNWKDFQTRNNNELVAILGNFANRVMVLTQKYFGGKVPELGMLNERDKEVVDGVAEFPNKIGKALDQFKFKEALNEFMNLSRLGNRYLTDTEPWKLIKEDEERVATILNIGLQLVANLAILGEPFLPFFSEKVFKSLQLNDLKWEDAGVVDLVKTGIEISSTGHLFDKIEDKEVEKQVEKLLNNKKEQVIEVKEEVSKPNITFDDFTKLDIRVATIIAAEKVAKTKKLLKITIDLGNEQRTVVSGIAEYFKPDEIIGIQVSVLINLEPRKLKGIESQGMILMAEDKDGSLKFVSPTNIVNNGSHVA